MGAFKGLIWGKINKVKQLDKIEIYSDGACSGNGSADAIGGYGAVMFAVYSDGSIATRNVSGAVECTTNNRMELLAVIKSLELLRVFNIPIEVFTDSQYVCRTINDSWKRNKNVDYWEMLDRLLIKFSSIKFSWVKGHASNKNNNKADMLATTAITDFRL